MPIPTPRSLKIGAIIDATLGVIERCAKPALVYAVALTAINAAIKYLTVEMTAPMDQLVIGFGTFAVGVVAAYFLIDAMLGQTGLRERAEKDMFLPFVVLVILYTLGFVAGLILIVIPGLVIFARWSLAQPMLMAQGIGAKQALGESWARTSGAEFPILVAALALLAVPVAVIIACAVLFDPADPMGIVIAQLAGSATTIVSVAMGVALYRLLVGDAAAAARAG
jgi:hypothetical protein